jgi:hypothetical protein
MTIRDHTGWVVFGAAALLAAIAPACGGADACMAVKCTSGAWMDIPLAAAPAAGTAVTVCRNAECYTAALPELPAADEASAGLSFPGVTFVMGTLWRDADGTVGLDLEWYLGSADAVADGDRYVVTFTDASGTATVKLDKLATYSTVAATPEACGPVDCRIAQLSP